MGAHCSQHCTDAVCCPAAGDDDDGGAVGSLTQVKSLSLFPESYDSEPPYGKVFDETVEHLRPLDRDLLIFCATSSLVAVRWLLRLGASQDARDSNGSTCLHVACRSGALSVMAELLHHGQLLSATDVAGWTPLHIAAHMGRREAVQRLLEARSDPLRLNDQGQSPAMLCMEPACLDLLRNWDPAADSREQLGAPRDRPERLADDTAGMPDACEPEMVFVASPPAARLDPNDRKGMLELGLRLFQLQPSRGLAFVVSVGLFDSYPAAMKAIIRASSQRPQAIGDFLGEAFSICPLARFSVFDAVALANTGVVSALRRAFLAFPLPMDLRKIDRLVTGLAQVWWRKHKSIAAAAEADGPRELSADAFGGRGELSGLDLWRFLPSCHALQQLMFSTVMLHWHLFSDDPAVANRELHLEDWVSLHRCPEGGGDVPEHVQRRIHVTVAAGFTQELALSPPASDLEYDGASALSRLSSLEGWVHVLSGPLSGAGAALWRWRDRGFSENLRRGGSPGDATAGLFGAGRAASPSPRRQRDDGCYWVAVRWPFLLLSAGPPTVAATAPHALLDLRTARTTRVDKATRTVTLEGTSQAEPVKLVLLLADGRWQELPHRQLELRLPDEAPLQEWARLFQGAEELTEV